MTRSAADGDPAQLVNSAADAFPAPKAHLTTVAEFPKNYFLENLAVRSDNSILITAMNHSELWYVPPADGDEQVVPMLLHKFDMLTMGIAEAEPDVFLMLACPLAIW